VTHAPMGTPPPSEVGRTPPPVLELERTRRCRQWEEPSCRALLWEEPSCDRVIFVRDYPREGSDVISGILCGLI